VALSTSLALQERDDDHMTLIRALSLLKTALLPPAIHFVGAANAGAKRPAVLQPAKLATIYDVGEERKNTVDSLKSWPAKTFTRLAILKR